MRSVHLTDEEYEPRPDFQPAKLRDARTVRVLYSEAIARWRVERGARELVDGTALEELSVGSPDWLVGEIFSHRGEAVVLEPADLRNLVAERARELAAELAGSRAGARA